MRSLLRFAAMVALLHVAALPFWLTAAEHADAPEKAAQEQLLRQLRSEDFVEREGATEQLKGDPVRHWEFIKRLAQHEDPEVRVRARAVMIAKADVLWERLGELVDSKNEFLRAFSNDARATVVRVRLEDWSEECRKKVVALEADYAVLKNSGVRGKALNEAEKKFRRERNLYQTRCDQLKHLVRSGGYRKVRVKACPKAWDPKLLPVEERDQLHVSFEFVDTPVLETVAWMSEMTGLTYELEKDVAKQVGNLPSINLRVTDMSANLAIGWICRLANLKVKADPKDPSRMMVGK